MFHSVFLIFCLIVFSKPPVWDKKDKKHSNRYVVDKCWREISAEMNEDGSLRARQANIDINRLQQIPNVSHKYHTSPYFHERRSIDFDQIRRSYDYDDNSSGLSQPFPPLHILYPTPTPYSKDTIKIHKPREDPKHYYQSDTYLQEVNLKNVDHEVAEVYPGRDVVRMDEFGNLRMMARKSRREENRIYSEYESCIRCPNDRTLVTKAGSDRVVLQAPRLLTCSGHTAPNNVKFIHMYGPKYGSLLTRGSHVVVGRITYNGKTLHLCKMQVHVIVQSCPVPKYLLAHCNKDDGLCNFTCKDSKLELQGEPLSVCGEDFRWENELPVCRVRNWCYNPIPPEHGRVTCKGNTMSKGLGLAEGSKCRIRCDPAWRPIPRGVTVCRRGVWTHSLQCQPKSRFSKL